MSVVELIALAAAVAAAVGFGRATALLLRRAGERLRVLRRASVLYGVASLVVAVGALVSDPFALPPLLTVCASALLAAAGAAFALIGGTYDPARRQAP